MPAAARAPIDEHKSCPLKDGAKEHVGGLLTPPVDRGVKVGASYLNRLGTFGS